MTKHRDLTGANIHVPYTFSYANSTARLAATGFVPSDIGKFAWQLDDDSFWILKDDSPITWAQVGGSAVAIDLNIGAMTEETTPASGDWFVLERTGARYKVDFDNMPSGTGTVLKTYWNADAPPASPTSQDDEFSNGSLDVKWTELDHDTILTVTEETTYPHAMLTAATRAGRNVCGLAQAIPAGDFTITCKAHFAGNGVNWAYYGLALWENLTATSDIYFFASQVGGGLVRNLVLHNMTDRNTFSTAPINVTSVSTHVPHSYFRIRRNGANYYYGVSPDGISWFYHSNNYNPAFTPGYFGIAVDNQATGANIIGRFDHFRYVASDVGTSGLLAGKLASIYE